MPPPNVNFDGMFDDIARVAYEKAKKMTPTDPPEMSAELADWCQDRAEIPPCSHFGMQRERFRRIAAALRTLSAERDARASDISPDNANELADVLRCNRSGVAFITSARELVYRWEVTVRERNKLKCAITEHWAQKADDRCVEDDDRLYVAAGLPPCDRHVGDKAAMLANCARFIDRRCEGGKWPSYAELEAENEKLRAAADGRADDGEAVTEQWLAELGFHHEPDDGVDERDPIYSLRVRVMAQGEFTKTQLIGKESPLDMWTRGRFLMLLAALGVESPPRRSC